MPIYLKKSKNCADGLLIYSPYLQFKPIIIDNNLTQIHEISNAITIDEFNKYAKVKIIDEFKYNNYLLENGSVISSKQYFGVKLLAVCLNVDAHKINKLRTKGFAWLDIIQYHDQLILNQSKFKVTYKNKDYKNIIDLCKHLKINYTKFKKYRETKPLEPLESCINKFLKKSTTTIYDHLGNEYSSQLEMCNYYNILPDVYHSRKKLNWTLEKILTTPSKSKYIQNIERTQIDHMGIEYDSFSQMCRHYGKSTATVRYRLRRGRTLKEALTMPEKTKSSNQIIYQETKYSSITELLLNYSISQSMYDRRKRANPNHTVTEIIDNILKDKLK